MASPASTERTSAGTATETEADGREAEELEFLEQYWSLNEKTYYTAFSRGGRTFHIGDCILVNVVEEDGETSNHAAELLHIWRNADGSGQVELRWLYTRNEFKCKTRPKPVRGLRDAELFETDHVDTCDAESISDKIRVLSLKSFQEEQRRFDCLRARAGRGGGGGWSGEDRSSSGNDGTDNDDNGNDSDGDKASGPSSNGGSDAGTDGEERSRDGRSDNRVSGGGREGGGARSGAGGSGGSCGGGGSAGGGDNGSSTGGGGGRSNTGGGGSSRGAASSHDGNSDEDSEPDTGGNDNDEEDEALFFCRSAYSVRSQSVLPLKDLRKRRARGRMASDLAKFLPRPGGNRRGTKRPAPAMATAAGEETVAAGGAMAAMEAAFHLAKKRLHLSAEPDVLLGREEECEKMYRVAIRAFRGNEGASIFLSGVPGQGKTASTRHVVRRLRRDVAGGRLPFVRVVEINAMQLTHPQQMYQVLEAELNNHKWLSRPKALSVLTKRFESADPEKERVILILDEMDYLSTQQQTLLYNVFNWPTFPNSRLLVVGIANTLNLLERVGSRLKSRMSHCASIVFTPYDIPQLQAILRHKLEDCSAAAAGGGIDGASSVTAAGGAVASDGTVINATAAGATAGCTTSSAGSAAETSIDSAPANGGIGGGSIFSRQAIEMASRKVCATAGDMRTAMHICSRAVEVCAERSCAALAAAAAAPATASAAGVPATAAGAAAVPAAGAATAGAAVATAGAATATGASAGAERSSEPLFVVTIPDVQVAAAEHNDYGVRMMLQHATPFEKAALVGLIKFHYGHKSAGGAASGGSPGAGAAGSPPISSEPQPACTGVLLRIIRSMWPAFRTLADAVAGELAGDIADWSVGAGRGGGGSCSGGGSSTGVGGNGRGSSGADTDPYPPPTEAQLTDVLLSLESAGLVLVETPPSRRLPLVILNRIPLDLALLLDRDPRISAILPLAVRQTTNRHLCMANGASSTSGCTCWPASRDRSEVAPN